MWVVSPQPIDASERVHSQLFGTTERALQVAMRARTGRLTGEDSEFRSVAWRLFLGELPADADVQEWANHIREKRDEYARLLAEYKLDPSKVSLLCTPEMAHCDFSCDVWGPNPCSLMAMTMIRCFPTLFPSIRHRRGSSSTRCVPTWRAPKPVL